MSSNIAYNLIFLIRDVYHNQGLTLKYYEDNINHSTFDNIIDLIKFRNSSNLREIQSSVYYFEFIFNNKPINIKYKLNSNSQSFFEISEVI